MLLLSLLLNHSFSVRPCVRVFQHVWVIFLKKKVELCQEGFHLSVSQQTHTQTYFKKYHSCLRLTADDDVADSPAVGEKM